MNTELNFRLVRERSAELERSAGQVRLVRDARATDPQGERGVVLARFFIFMHRGAGDRLERVAAQPGHIPIDARISSV